MRCLSVAEAFRRAGKQCVFVTSGNEIEELFNSRGFENTALLPKCNDINKELNALGLLIRENEPELLFVDSYHVTEEYLSALQQICHECNTKLVYIDDLLTFPYPCDLLINYNIYGEERSYEALYVGKRRPDYLIGPMYVPLREEFRFIPERSVRETGRSIMVSTGGADPEHFALNLVNVINAHDTWRGYKFHFVLGRLNSDMKQIKSIVLHSQNIVIHENVQNMSTLMQRSDLAVSAAGSTLYELCATQTPTITYVLADNQIAGAEAFEKAQIMHNVGDIRDIGIENAADIILREAVCLANDYQLRKSYSKKMRIVDGNGADRIVNYCLNKVK